MVDEKAKYVLSEIRMLNVETELQQRLEDLAWDTEKVLIDFIILRIRRLRSSLRGAHDGSAPLPSRASESVISMDNVLKVEYKYRLQNSFMRQKLELRNFKINS